MSEPKFLTGSLMRHVTVMSFTSGLGLMAVFAVDLVDMKFITMLGNEALAAAIGFAGSLIFITTSISIGLSIAAGALVARAIGAKEFDQAKRNAASVLVIALAIAFICLALLQYYMVDIIALLGAEGDVLDHAVSYSRIVVWSMPIMAAAMIMSALVRAHGNPKAAMMATLSGSIVNLILDPVFIFVFDWGIEGAALASVAARITMLVMGALPVIKQHHALARPNIAHMLEDLGKVLKIAAPAMMTNIATPIGNAIVTYEMSFYGTDAVGGMAIVGRLIPFSFAVIFSLSGSVGPIIGQNMGAKRKDRVYGTLKASFLFCLTYVIAVSALLFVFRDFIADMFSAEGVTRDFIYLFCGPLSLVFFFQGTMFIGNAACNNLGHPLYATVTNWARNTIGIWPLALLGGYWYDGLGVFIGQSAGAIIFAFLSWFLTIHAVERGFTDKDTEKIATLARFQLLFGRRR